MPSAAAFPRVMPGPRDRAALEQLRRAGRVPEPPAVEQDYRGCVVQKPWGFEFLAYDTPDVAAWRLRINTGHSTSMHCHPRKRTALMVLAGSALCHVFGRRYTLHAHDVLILEAGVFHATKATGPDGVDLIEVETPRCKTDLVRLNDLYGREGVGYEDARHMHSDRLERFDHFSLLSTRGTSGAVTYTDARGRFRIAVGARTPHTLSEWGTAPGSRALVVLSGGLTDHHGNIVAGIGEAVSPLAASMCRPHGFRPVVALTLEQPGAVAASPVSASGGRSSRS